MKHATDRLLHAFFRALAVFILPELRTVADEEDRRAIYLIAAANPSSSSWQRLLKMIGLLFIPEVLGAFGAWFLGSHLPHRITAVIRLGGGARCGGLIGFVGAGMAWDYLHRSRIRRRVLEAMYFAENAICPVCGYDLRAQ